jgi:hypothetical protein
MSGENLVSISFTPEQRGKCREALQTLQDMLQPSLVALSPTDRQELPKMGDKSVAFVEKTMQYGIEHTDLVPCYVNMDELRKDLDAVKELRSLLVPLQKLTSLLEDTTFLAGSEAYSASLAFYGAIKNAAKNNVPGAANAYQDLKKRFPGRGPAEQSKSAQA